MDLQTVINMQSETLIAIMCSIWVLLSIFLFPKTIYIYVYL